MGSAQRTAGFIVLAAIYLVVAETAVQAILSLPAFRSLPLDLVAGLGPAFSMAPLSVIVATRLTLKVGPALQWLVLAYLTLTLINIADQRRLGLSPFENRLVSPVPANLAIPVLIWGLFTLASDRRKGLPMRSGVALLVAVAALALLAWLLYVAMACPFCWG